MVVVQTVKCVPGTDVLEVEEKKNKGGCEVTPNAAIYLQRQLKRCTQSHFYSTRGEIYHACLNMCMRARKWGSSVGYSRLESDKTWAWTMYTL